MAATADSSSVQNLLSEAFIQDDFATQCAFAQKITFLRTGIVPAAGQRVELTVFLNSTERGDIPFRLSGEVTVVHPTPSWKSGEGSVVFQTWRPSYSPDDYGACRGSSVLAYVLRKKLPQERSNSDGSTPNLNGIWDRVVTNKAKDEIKKKVINKFGALHGQRVVCEGRLNFDYEFRRGRTNEEGPWSDCIPFDGKDVWRFVLVADDSMQHIWRADLSSFVNLGENQRSRCWPWSDGNVLPFARPLHDLPLTGHGPNGSLPIHVCKGPFGCDGNDHSHSFPASAA